MEARSEQSAHFFFAWIGLWSNAVSSLEQVYSKGAVPEINTERT